MKYVPPRSPKCYVPRPRLFDELDRGADVPLTTVVGPPGSGKTVAVASWVAERPKTPTVWMSCDVRDVDPVSFWAGAIESLQQTWPGAGMDARDLLDEDTPPLEEVATTFAAQVSALREPVCIVVDDLHVAKAAAPSVAAAVDNLAAPARLVLVSRSDPPFPLHRLRMRQELVEVREDVLRLSESDTTALAQALGVRLGGKDATLLHERTDGWMAAVHLAALSLRDREDVTGFLQTFSGQNRLMAEFLLAEVLSTLSPDVRQFLEDTSVLEELDGPGCRALTGRADGVEVLRAMSAENMLVLSDGDGYTYRYQQLFRDLLQAELRATSPERFVALHKIAAQLYEARSELGRAAAHLTIAGDNRAAFALLRDHAFTLFATRGTSAVESLISVLDLRYAAEDPGRAADVALALASAGVTNEAERWVSRVQAFGSGLSAADKGRLAVSRAMMALFQGDAVACETALSGLPSESDLHDAVIDAVPLLAMRSRLLLDETADARAVYGAALAHGHESIEVSEVMLTAALSAVACTEGRLHEAQQLADEALWHAERFGTVGHPMVSDALRTRGRVFYEQGRFEEAEPALERSIAVAERTRPSYVALSAAVLARVWTAQGQYSEAAALLQQARLALRAKSSNPVVDLINACDAQRAIAEGDLDGASTLTATLGPSDRRRRLEATLHLEREHPDRALAVLAACHPTTHRQRLDTAVLRTRALFALGDDAAGDCLAECVELARTEGFVVPLTDALPELGVRVSFHLRSAPVGDFEEAVLDRLDRPHPSAAVGQAADLVEHLTSREHVILRYLDSRLTVTDIAAECFVSRNTLKTHIRAIYRKLGVSSRQEAIGAGRRVRLI